MADSLTIARPYASALFEQADAHGTLKEWSSVLQCLVLTVRDARVKGVAYSPNWSDEQRKQLFVDVVEAALGSQITLGVQLKNFIALIVLNKRLVVLPEIAEVYQRLVARRESITRVEATAAYALSEEQLDTLRQALELRFDSSIKLNVTEDSSLIGGVILRSGNWVMDGSIKGKLSRLSGDLAEQ
jgi:F-type H+-transporting ATPase subunit delta